MLDTGVSLVRDTDSRDIWKWSDNNEGDYNVVKCSDKGHYLQL